jgi:hypothetical protein
LKSGACLKAYDWLARMNSIKRDALNSNTHHGAQPLLQRSYTSSFVIRSYDKLSP